MQHEVKKARVMVVDDHPIVREGLRLLINSQTDLQVCCESDCCEQAVAGNRACPHDIVIVDMSLGSSSGLELIRRLQFEFPELPILMLSMHDELIYAEPALKAGAKGYLMKQTATGSLLTAIRQVLRGDLYVSDRLRTKMLKQMVSGNRNDSAVSELSPSELEVLHLIGAGLGTSEIAEELSRSIKTIESHKANIKKKLGLENANQLSCFAAQMVASGEM